LWDFRICQTMRASPAKPGGLPFGLEKSSNTILQNKPLFDKITFQRLSVNPEWMFELNMHPIF
ncbi:hypothetical protein, partial [uncultured Microbulbifer sp.]|uniref:hypothetical protein n=1 Tax=uncultured Microbulbifer sp. TaxID=348147 RepID=UPI0026385F21